MKPPFAYFGGKTRLASEIAGLMPSHHVYLEPFAGSLAVLFAKTPAVNEIVNDVDGAIVTFFRVLRDRPDDLERAVRLTPYARDEFAASDDLAGDDVELARRFWVRVTQSFNKTSWTKAGWSVTTARGRSAPNDARALAQRFAACADRLQQVAIENRDAIDVIERYSTPETVIYADPPYVSATRRNGTAAGSPRDYRHDMGGREAHERLAAALNATEATVLLSGYRSDLYDDLYSGWDRLDINVHVGTADVNGIRARAVESIWSNRPIAAQGRLDLDPIDAENPAYAGLSVSMGDTGL